MKEWIITVCFFPFLEMASQEIPAVSQTDLFDEAIELLKQFEGWHFARHHPYVGYGHRLLPHDSFRSDITEQFADSLLRTDLKQKCAVFRKYGKDSLLLGVLSFNTGESRVIKSKLLQKIESGNRDIKEEYLSFRKWKGKIIQSLEKRRKAEYELLFDKTKTIVKLKNNTQ